MAGLLGGAPSAGAAASPQEEAEQLTKIRDFFMHFNKISEMCFTDCIWDFTSRDVRGKEEKCAISCLEKFLKASNRISQRFQEHQMIANESAMAAMKAGK
ncbi:mitochondrial import inner membrane translocase subunit Tim9-like [Amphibalanus amphitrite]|uniref:mitochondrial import inner membrane translocase subunit Tim9-like n=1 Tax=Amphibalanus amphitrite TaxID=1232801 RepID=UPI001C91806B|nr:mitochondrial import inner membrane translocase subunit Tim9-like [Amphibalanus amphitrite]XP_043221427.1 mitochondrial import inner membrane translocase subunit Tim9-like [Amphibalanus amphitrite]XP_043221428.1 mitochondrial import inner membrane translocase subunit Tim9-like [Amphibalanus amphitrite]XP_043221429.1 mitochondrial import inner membrane translocase subunit Tim9-like [Amphibalanus amphitrite]XP_043221430.1 mitochondrial import inner membrane translocase subunit Tim9-like [Amphi